MKTHNLYLVRHGQSIYNLENRFTGWKDIDLTDLGKRQAKEAGEILSDINFDYCFISNLKRAQDTLDLILNEIKQSPPVESDVALNERDYGDLTGLNKQETAEKYGKEQVHIWRRSFDVPPPGGESLKNVVERVKPYFDTNIEPELKKKKNILISAHGNSLRAMMICVGLYQPGEITKIELPTGSPFVFCYEEGQLIKSEYLV